MKLFTKAKTPTDAFDDPIISIGDLSSSAISKNRKAEFQIDKKKTFNSNENLLAGIAKPTAQSDPIPQKSSTDLRSGLARGPSVNLSDDGLAKKDDFERRILPSRPSLNFPKFKSTPEPPPSGSPRVSSPPTDPEKSPLQKYSSTSSLYIKDTIQKPDQEELLKCMASALMYHIKLGSAQTEKKYYDIFDERINPLGREFVSFYKLPEEDKVFEYVRNIYVFERMDPECVIMCLAYIERLITSTKITLDTTNWRRVVLAGFIVALKAWEELAVWNHEFIACFKGYVTIKDLNQLESQFLNLIQFNAFLKGSMYTKYYFELKGFSKAKPEDYQLQPLTKEKAKLLKVRSTSFVQIVQKVHSLADMKPRLTQSPAILN